MAGLLLELALLLPALPCICAPAGARPEGAEEPHPTAGPCRPPLGGSAELAVLFTLAAQLAVRDDTLL